MYLQNAQVKNHSSHQERNPSLKFLFFGTPTRLELRSPRLGPHSRNLKRVIPCKLQASTKKKGPSGQPQRNLSFLFNRPQNQTITSSPTNPKKRNEPQEGAPQNCCPNSCARRDPKHPQNIQTSQYLPTPSFCQPSHQKSFEKSSSPTCIETNFVNELVAENDG